MRATFLLLGGIVVLSVAVARALSCVCSPLECDDLTEEDCPGGLTWDPCRCCKVCARVEGEPCGGLFGFSGSCAVGLQCVIKNLLHHAREVDEGVCAKIPGRWRRHCPHRPIMSGSGCNLVGEGTTTENGNTVATGKCVCGPSVPWCLEEPRPYVYKTRHECKINLAAKIAYDDLFNSGDTAEEDDDDEADEADEADDDDVDVEGLVQDVVGECPKDSVPNESGGCKCTEICPPSQCPSGQRPIQTKLGSPETPGNCCPRYNCVSPDVHGSTVICPEDSIPTGDGRCKCVPTCPSPICQTGQRPFEVRPAVPETPGSCCPLYDCKPSESVSWVDADEGKAPRNCFHGGVSRKLGEKWQESDCVHCVCEDDGTVSCQTTMCKSCENPSPRIPGECCPHCPIPTNATIFEPPVSCRTSLTGCTLRCKYGYAIDKNNCRVCECARQTNEDDDERDEDDDNDDNEDNEDDEEDHDTPAPPVLEEDNICPEPPRCESSCDLLKDEKGCLTLCDCSTIFAGKSNGSVAGQKVCPEVKCDLHCERGLLMDDNDCTFCECKPSHTGCPPIDGCKKRCTFGYKTNKRGCPVCRCRASCTDRSNETHPEGSIWQPNSCTTCTCESGGRLNCKETICSVACNNPLPPKPGTCCPVCPISVTKNNETGHQHTRGWGTVPITLIVVLALLCLLLIVHIVRNRFRGRLSPSEASYTSCPPQYYKCVPAYDTPVHRNEKIVPV